MLMVSNISELESAAHQLYVLKIEDGGLQENGLMPSGASLPPVAAFAAIPLPTDALRPPTAASRQIATHYLQYPRNHNG